MKQICKNCHFLSKEMTGNGESNNFTFSLTNKERDNISILDKSYISLKCSMGVWDEGVIGQVLEKREHIIYKTNRKRKCFYWKYQHGMLFDAAKKLQKREQENGKLRTTLMWTVIAIFISAMALIINALKLLL